MTRRTSLPLSCPLSLPSLLLAALLFTACADEAAVPAAEPPAPPVEALQAREGTLPLVERLNGVVRADNQVVVRPELPGRVVEVMVRSGEAVEKGQPLVRLDPQGVRERLRQAEAELRLARAAAVAEAAALAEMEAEVSRTRRLADEDLVSDLELETLEARLDAAEAVADEAAARVDEALATVEERRAALDRAVVRAPTSGHVGRRTVEVGTMADPSTPLFVVGDLDDLVVEVPLTEEMLSRIGVGEAVLITPRAAGSGADAADASFRGTLSRISPFLEPGSFTTTAEIDVENAGDTMLRPGMFVRVDVLYGESERATLLPSSALWEDPRTGVLGVYVFTESLGIEPLEDGTSEDARAEDDAADGDEALVLGPTDAVDPRDPGDESYAVELRRVEVLAKGRSMVGVRGVEPGEWVVVVGQHLLAAAGDDPRARVRTARWERILGLQSLQREDLLAGFLEKQRRFARERGAEPPSNAEYLGAGRDATATAVDGGGS